MFSPEHLFWNELAALWNHGHHQLEIWLLGVMRLVQPWFYPTVLALIGMILLRLILHRYIGSGTSEIPCGDVLSTGRRA